VRFASDQLDERRSASLPPFSHLALLRAEARTAEAAKAFLDAAAALAQDEGVLVYPPVPHAVARVADVERMQMLVEASQRARLQAFLRGWVPALIALKRERAAEFRAVLRWAVDVDPLAI
jgi:primosomal protein N' (replication factor Y)